MIDLIAAMVGAELDGSWTPARFREAAALIIGAAGHPIAKDIAPTLQTAIRLVGLELANGTKARGEIRSQFCHVIDVAPTVLEVAGLPEPTIVNSVQQMPLQGTSMVYSFDDAQAAERHEIQYFEMFVNRGIYHKGWTAVTRHSTPWDTTTKLHPYDEDVWELYAPDDWSQAHDLSKEMPDLLHKLQRQFLIEATQYNALPLDDRQVERLLPQTAGRRYRS